MTRQLTNPTNCSIGKALGQVGDAWSMMIIRECTQGRSRFDEFQRELGIARNILTTRLERLVELEVLERYPLKERTGAFGYRLTSKGEDLYPVIVGLMQWGDRWLASACPPIALVEASTNLPIAPMAVRAQDGRALSFKDIRFAPGPGATARTRVVIDERNQRVSGNDPT